MNLNRRSFLKAAALGVTAAGLSMGSPFTAAADESHKTNEKGKWTSSTCQGCTSFCPVKVYTQKGRVLRIKGNPNCTATGGAICPRPHLAIQQLYDPDRIKTPMKRTNPQKGRGIDPGFVPISWDEALGTVADKLMELQLNKETHKLMMLKGRSTQVGDVLNSKFPILFGTPNYYGHSTLCAEVEKAGAYYTEGYFGYRDYDLSKAKCIIMWSTDPIASNRQVSSCISRWGDVMDGAKIYVVDPRLSVTAAKADKWLPVIPGTDGALACAMAHVILTKGLWNKEFVGNFKEGVWNRDISMDATARVNLFIPGETVDEEKFEYNKGYGLVRWWNIELKDTTPEWAEEITGIPADTITEVATQFGKYGANSISWMSPGVSNQPRGIYGAMAANALNGLVGSTEHEGGTMRTASMSAGSLPDHNRWRNSNARSQAKKPKIDGRVEKEFLGAHGGKINDMVISNRLADVLNGEVEDAGWYETKVLISTWCNFAYSATGAQRWEKALASVPFYCCITTNPSESAMFADIVLPAKHHLFERWGCQKNYQNLYSYMSVQQPVITPLWDTLTDETEIAWELAKKLDERGFSDIYKYFSRAFVDPETGNLPTSAAQFAEICVKLITAPFWDGSAEAAGQGDSLKSWRNFASKGVFNSKPASYKKHWGDFGTRTGRFEFYSETLRHDLEKKADMYRVDTNQVMEWMGYEGRDGKAFVPHYEPPVRMGSEDEYPYIFEEHRSRLNREGRSANCVGYQEFKDLDPGDEAWDDVIKINPLDMRELGLKDGDEVRVSSVQGSIIVHAKGWEGTRPGVVIKCYGQGHWAYGHVAALSFDTALARGGNNNEILPSLYDHISNNSARHGGFTRVKIEKSSEIADGPVLEKSKPSTAVSEEVSK